MAKPLKSPDFPHVFDAETYVKQVISGKIPACKWVKLACERHVRDTASSITKDFPYVFDPAIAEKVCKFAEMLPHTKGKWAKKDHKTGEWAKIKLEPWQKFLLASTFGWVKKKDGKRRFLRVRWYIPRKNAKSVMGAVIGLYCLIYDKESGAEVYCGATTEKQALEVHRVMWEMIRRTPKLQKHFGIITTGKVTPGPILLPDGSRAEPVIGNPGDGASPHCAITDEYHEHKTSALLDTMETGMGARDQPLSVVISTAGSNIAGPCREDWKACERVLENTKGFEDETLFTVIWTLDKGESWATVEALQKANPNWGVSIDRDQMEAKLKTAIQRANMQSSFRTKHLNEWVATKDAYFNIEQWRALAKPEIVPEDFKDNPCYLAGDLASKHDLVCQIQLFCLPDKRYAVFGRYWIPEATLLLEENQHYRNWHISGHLEVAGEDITDLEVFKDAALEACKNFQVEEMPSDPNRAWGVYPEMEKAGVPIVEYRNTVPMFSEPLKQLDALIRSGAIIHNGDPILEWAIGNTLAKEDLKGNVYPNKENAASKIDPVVSLVMALGRAMTRDPEPSGSLLFF